jgi:hypothetical protein
MTSVLSNGSVLVIGGEIVLLVNTRSMVRYASVEALFTESL